MSLTPIDWRPDSTKLAQFSTLTMCFLGMLAAPLAYLRDRPTLAACFGIAALTCRLLGAWRPTALRPVYLGLSLATWPIGWGVSHLALAIVYYGVITPMALVFRLLGRDAMTRRFDRDATTYWEPTPPDRSLDRYLRQF
ncbi:SxtJ family membrane protein [Singulisphaera sp. Ch08]|uniref:SxtJ family membrane protein n=1 Tax=Singulisphaera sp. Ch08 TaxID=3120278 RepID=A0AAU7CL35_9BACT